MGPLMFQRWFKRFACGWTLLCLLLLSGPALGQEKEIVYGADENFPPFHYADKNGQPAGYDIDLINAVARETGLHIRIVVGPWSKIRQQFEQGNIDIVSMIYSQPRSTLFDFSTPYSVMTYALFVRDSDSRLHSLNDLHGRTVMAVTQDIVTETLLTRGIHTIPVANAPSALRLLAQGHGDAVAVGKIVGLYFLHSQGIHNVHVVSDALAQPPYCFAVRRNRHDALLARLNEGLAVVQYNGAAEQIADKWLGPWERTTQWRRFVWLIGGPLATLLVLALAWSWMLQRLVRERTASLQIELAERQRAESRLREANRTLEATLRASPVAIFGYDLDGKITIWNKTCEEMFGWTADEVLNQYIPCAPEERRDETRLHLQRTLNGETFTQQELQRQRKDGTLLDVSASFAPLRDDQGRIKGGLGVYVDHTQRKRLEAQLLQAQKMESVGRLAGGLAHDFNNLLSVILGYGELLAREIPANYPWHERVDEILDAGQRAAALTAQLLAFSRRQILQPQTVNLNKLLEDTHKMLTRVIRENIVLKLELENAVHNIKADSGQIVQVILNLAVNARDAMPAGGTLTLAASDVVFTNAYNEQGTVVPAGHYVVLTVQDTGVGMSAETRARIFEPFFTTKPPEMGTGLGLATVHGIVNQSGGYISVTSAPGAGTTFKIYFPQLRVEELAAERATQPPSEKLERGTETLLLVEDAMALRTMICENLQNLGYTVLTAANGVEALEVARVHLKTIDLLITDVVMPLLGGVELYKQISELRPELPVLFMSGYADESLAQEQNGRHVVLIQKPFRMHELASTLREIFATCSAPPFVAGPRRVD